MDVRELAESILKLLRSGSDPRGIIDELEAELVALLAKPEEKKQ